ncbi:MAG: polysaccharide biosynthesis C-terminal domain-containing protein, partial [Chitinophagales bacterium]|nr:polysaccharide biosynthesis C-terminal domain-containing protein [Chitinophagales bacterium]MDW8428431.1 polysaccharide biosynthesis C-terminal domain-containing protein [Chitinophagales bacterium]
MQRFFYRNLAFLITVNLLIKPIWLFGIDRSVQNAVDASEYGLYFVLLNLSMLTMVLLDLGLSSFNNRAVAGNTQLLTMHVPHLLTIKLLLAFVYLATTVVAALVLGYTHRALFMLAWIAANQIMASLIMFLRSNINALHHFTADSIFSILDKAIVIVVCGAMLAVPDWRARFQIEWFVYAQTAAYLIALLSCFAYLLKLRVPFFLQWPDPFTKGLLRQAMPFAVLIFLMSVYGRVDAVMLKQLLGEEGKTEAGIYAAAYRILDALNQIGYLFSILLLPVLSRQLANRLPVTTLVRSSSVLLYVYSVTAAVSICVFAREIIDLLYHKHEQQSTASLKWLIYALIGYSLSYVFSTLLTAAGQLWQLTVIACGVVVLNVALNLMFIPRYGAMGAAAAAALTAAAAA